MRYPEQGRFFGGWRFIMASHARHYEKVITVCCFAFQFVNIGMASSSFAVFQPHIVALPDVGAVGGSMALSVRMLVSLSAMFFVNIYLDKVGVAWAWPSASQAWETASSR